MNIASCHIIDELVYIVEKEKLNPSFYSKYESKFQSFKNILVLHHSKGIIALEGLGHYFNVEVLRSGFLPSIVIASDLFLN